MIAQLLIGFGAGVISTCAGIALLLIWLLRWDRAGGKKVRGLTRRREAEYAVCIGDE